MLLDKETRLLLFLRHSRVYDAVIPHLKSDYFESKKARAVFETFKELESPAVSLSVLAAHLAEKLLPKTVRIIKAELREMRDETLSPEELSKVMRKFEKFLKDRMFSERLQSVIDNGQTDQDLSAMSEIAGFSLQNDKVTNFSKLSTITRLVAKHEQTDLIRSSFSCINRSLVYGAFAKGQVNLWCAAPGVGKSTIMITEGCHALRQGRKVFAIYLGDLEEFDVLTRWQSCLAQANILKVAMDPMSFRKQTLGFMKNFRAICASADEYTAADLFHLCRKMKQTFDFDVVIIDYDSNIKATMESLYAEGGSTYATIDRIAKQLGCLVHIGSQTKVAFWQSEVVPKEGAAESSKKQHVADMMIGLGVNDVSPEYGTCHLAKVRRGGGGMSFRVHMDMAKSTIREVSQEEYEAAIQKKSMTGPGSKDGALKKRKFEGRGAAGKGARPTSAPGAGTGKRRKPQFTKAR